MKLSWLGKLFLADAAIQVTKSIMKNDHSSHDVSSEESHFSNIEIKHMMEAVERNDYESFKEVYKDRRPHEGKDRIIEAYEWFQERKKNDWS